MRRTGKYLEEIRREVGRLVGATVIILVLMAGCDSSDAGSGADEQHNPQAQTTSDNSLKPNSSAPAETKGFSSEQARAEVGEDGLHLEVGRYKFDAPSGVAPVGTKVEITTFQEEPYEVAARGEEPETTFERLSSRTALQGTGQETALAEEPSSITLQNTGRGFVVDAPEGVQLEKPLQVTFASNEYGGSLQDVEANEPAPVLLREQGDGLVWGGDVSYDEDRSIVDATLYEFGKYSIGVLKFVNEAGGFMNEVADQMFTGGTPRPDCHEQPIETSVGGTVSVDVSPKTVWACLEEDGENAIVTLINDYPSPLVVRHESPEGLQYPDSLSPGDEYTVEYIRKFLGKEVLPDKGKATLTFPVNSLPASIDLSTDLEVANAMLYGRELESQATSFGGPLLSTYPDAQFGMDCFDNVLRQEYAAGTACFATFAGKKATKVGAVIRAGEAASTLAGQLMDEITGPRTVTINYEPPPGRDQLDQGLIQFDGEWFVHGARMIILWDATSSQFVNVGPCTDPFEPGGSEAMCRQVRLIEFSEAPSDGIIGTITEIRHETWEGDSPPPGFEPSSDVEVGDSFKLEFVDNNLLRTTWLGRLSYLNGQGNPYWCNSQTSDENVAKCGA